MQLQTRIIRHGFPSTYAQVHREDNVHANTCNIRFIVFHQDREPNHSQFE